MSVNITYRAERVTSSDASSYTTTPTWTPAANSLLIVLCDINLNHASNITGVTGHGLTYTQIGTTEKYNASGSDLQLAIFVADAGASPTSVAATASFGAVAAGGIIFELEVTGADVSGGVGLGQAIVQFDSEEGSGTSGTVTLAAASHVENRPLSFWGHNANEAVTHRTNWTELRDRTSTLPSQGTECQWRSDAFEATASASWSSSVGWGGLAVEIKAIPSALPEVDTTDATSVLGTTATLNGTVDPNDLGAGDAWFRWDTANPPLANDTSPATSIADGGSPVAFSKGLTGLSAGTTYFYRGVFDNGSGEVLGDIVQFTTLSATNHGQGLVGPGTPLEILYVSNGNPLYVLLTWWVYAGGLDSTAAVSGVTFDGSGAPVALTFGGRKAVKGNTMEWWKLHAPATATGVIKITMAAERYLSAGVVNRAGWPSAVADHHFAAEGDRVNVRTPQVTVTSASGSEVLDWLGFNDQTTDVGANSGQSVLWNEEGTGGATAYGGEQVSAAGLLASTATTATRKWTMTGNVTEYWGHAALSYGSTFLQKITQFVERIFWAEDADEPPDVVACVGDGTNPSGTNPAAGDSLDDDELTAWIEITSTAGTTYRWSNVAINNATRKEPRVESFAPTRRVLADTYEAATAGATLSDWDRLLRGLHAAGTLKGGTYTEYVGSLPTIRSNGTAHRRFHGVIRDFRPLPNLLYEIEAEDRLTFLSSASGADRMIPPNLVSSDISDQNPIERMIGKPVPDVYGSCSDEDDTEPVGVVPLYHIAHASVAPDFDNLPRFLLCGHELTNVQSVFLPNYLTEDEPTVRIKAPGSAYGSVLKSVPFQAGAFANYEDVAGRRYVFVYMADNHIASDLAISGRIPLLANVCGKPGANGLMLSNPARVYLDVLNNRVAQEQLTTPLAIASLGAYSLFDTLTFEAAAAVCAARSYVAAGIVGADLEQVSFRDIDTEFCKFDFLTGINRHGQKMVAMLDLGSAYSSVVTFTDADVIEDSLTTDPKDQPEDIENEVQSVYKRNYAEALHALVPPEGARPNRDPFDGRWRSGLQKVADETIITAMGGRPLGLRQSEVIEYNMVRDATTHTGLTASRLAWKKVPRPLVQWRSTMRKAASVELGDVVKLNHTEMIWSSVRRLQVVAIEDDLNNLEVVLTCRDVDNRLA